MLTRRRFFQSLAAGAALSPLGARHSAAQGLGTDYDVIVVGAGLSGLVAAQRLSALVDDPKILVLEARDRIGGRVWSEVVKSKSREAELGALHLPDAPSALGEGDWTPLSELELSIEALPSGLRTLYPSMCALTRALAEESLGTVQLDSPVTSVFFREGLVGVSYRNLNFESNVSTRRLVITVPPPVYLDGGLEISPALPDAKIQALRSASAEAAISFAALFPADAATLTTAEDSWAREEGAVSYRAFRIGQQRDVLLEAQFRSSRAAALAGQSDDIIAGLALRGFAGVLESVPQPGAALTLRVVDWQAEPFSGGARFDLADAAAVRAFMEPVQNTVFFAGDFTVAGSGRSGLAAAYTSGIRVAEEVARTLGADVPADDDEGVILEPF
jgi:monoamine oxidase